MSVLGNIIFAFLFLVGVYVYVSLIRQIRRRTSPSTDESARTFGFPEAILAAILVSLLLLSVVASVSNPSTQLSTRDLVANLIIAGVEVFFLAGFLKLRGFNLDALGGFSKISIARAVTTGALLLLVAYPLISVADAITQRLLGSGSSKQNIIELFTGSRTMEQRIMIIIFAVAIAPVAEEFIFRFFLYGVFKRYFGRWIGLALNALLFAAVHNHLPSFAPLFVLGGCFTLAYEWSGSILVPMTMHSLFNALSLTALAFPELVQQ